MGRNQANKKDGENTNFWRTKIELLLIVGEQSRQNLRTDPSHVKLLPYNSLACPLREVKLSSDLRNDPSSLLFDDFESFLPGFFYLTFGRTACTPTIFNRSFTTFEYKSKLKSLCSSVELPLKTVFFCLPMQFSRF